MSGSMLNYTRATWAQRPNFAAVKVEKPSAERCNLNSAAHFVSLLCPGMMQACDANTRLTIYPNSSKQTVLGFWYIFLFISFFFFLLQRMPLSEPYLAGSLGIDPPPFPAASLSASTSAEDDMFSDSASSMTALEWNPQPWSLAASATSIIPFLTNSSHPSLNLIGLWSRCKTKTANLGSTRLNTSCFSKFFELRFSQSLRKRKKKTWQSQFRCSDVAPSFLA